jgi:phospholipid/cholesterol/gamma-HCH transport system substrate-binding protein
MATGTNHWKLGLFVIVGVALSLASLVALGARNWNEKSVSYVSYFDESVQGLELGSPVKFRGVTVGRVSAIDIAPNQRHVAVTSSIESQQLERLNLGGPPGGEGEATPLLVHPELRVQLAQTGITGVKFVLIDYFDPLQNPVLELPFPVPDNYLPAAPSTLKNLETAVTKTSDRFPDIARDVAETMAKVNALMDQIDNGKLPERAMVTLDQTNLAMRQLNQQLAALDAGALSKNVQKTLGAFDSSLARVNQLLDHVSADQGVLAGAQHSLDALAEVARGAQSIGPELETTLREVQGAARSIRRFADALERDPDMLIKGRAQ